MTSSLARRRQGCWDHIPLGFLPLGATPLPSVPVSFRSMYQLCSSALSFFSVNAKMLPPFLIASFFCASSWRASEIRSKPAEEGHASARRILSALRSLPYALCFDCTSSFSLILLLTFLERHVEEKDSDFD